MKRKRKTKERRPIKVAADETDQAGVNRYLKMAFRKAVEKTGPVFAIGMERRR
jgi:hypothetical protein